MVQTPSQAAAAGTTASMTAAACNSLTFTLVNHSVSRHYRFKWPEHPLLSFSPGVGHLHAGAAKAVKVTFTALAPVRIDGQDLKLALSQITYKARVRLHAPAHIVAGSCIIGRRLQPCDVHKRQHAGASAVAADLTCPHTQGEPMDWDDIIAANLVAAGVRASSATRAVMGLPGAGPKPGAEPLIDLVARTQRDLAAKVSGIAAPNSSGAFLTSRCFTVWCVCTTGPAMM